MQVRSRLLLRLLITWQWVIRSFPRRKKIEVAKFLGQPNRFVDDTLLLVVVTHLDEAGERKILAQRMTLETVVGEDAAHVGMAGEQDAIEIVGFALEPLRSPEYVDDR